jgi:hypothetical protein
MNILKISVGWLTLVWYVAHLFYILNRMGKHPVRSYSDLERKKLADYGIFDSHLR